MEIRFSLPFHLVNPFLNEMTDPPAEDGTRQSKRPIYTVRNSDGIWEHAHWQLMGIENNILTVESPNQQSFITTLINYIFNYGEEKARGKYSEGFDNGQQSQYIQKTDMEKFVAEVSNLNVYDLSELAKSNEFILQDILQDFPGVIKKLDEMLQKAKVSQPIEGTVKPTKIPAGEEIIFFFERKLIRKGRRIVIGLNEEKKRISLDYAWLYNCTWIEERQYVIKNLGLVEGRRRRDPSYYAFEIKEINEAD